MRPWRILLFASQTSLFNVVTALEPAPIANAVYVGCFPNLYPLGFYDEESVGFGFSLGGGDPAACQQRCRGQRSFRYAAMYDEYCSCSFEGTPPISRAGALDDSACNVPCGRNASAPCGARGRPPPHTIYQVNDPPTVHARSATRLGPLRLSLGEQRAAGDLCRSARRRREPGRLPGRVCRPGGGSYVEMYSFYDGRPTCRCLTAATTPLSGGSFPPEGCNFNCPANSSAACGGFLITDPMRFRISRLFTAYIEKTPENPQTLFRDVVIGDVFFADFNLGCVDGSVLSRHVHDINVVNRDTDGFNVFNRDIDDINVINRDIHVVDTRDLLDRRDAIDISHPIKRGGIDITINVFTVDIRVVVDDTGSFNVTHGLGRLDVWISHSLEWFSLLEQHSSRHCQLGVFSLDDLRARRRVNDVCHVRSHRVFGRVCGFNGQRHDCELGLWFDWFTPQFSLHAPVWHIGVLQQPGRISWPGRAFGYPFSSLFIRGRIGFRK
ncbi:hypothetical protein C8035_v009258 [Colletotrichum spinosum]|uniref:WSC domain-containing protein n=1 Tax=Colletotrichum spinosum TaxID=1347390 RepID=A0A4R8Q603_9PEZI|nr:hypothetical protein C8035_v009258 [Colletotrichum spinosum]